MLLHRESAYCPTCGINSSQERVKGKRGVRYCGGCGEYFTLKDSREAEQVDLHIAAVDSKYDQREAHHTESLACPFCKDVDFDFIGLKAHLLGGHCDAFESVETLWQERNRLAEQSATRAAGSNPALDGLQFAGEP